MASKKTIQKARRLVRDKKYPEASAIAAPLFPEGMVYHEWGDALALSGKLNEAITVYRTVVYRSGLEVASNGKAIPGSERDWIDRQGRSLRTLVRSTNDKQKWSGAYSGSTSVLMRYALLLCQAGEYEEAAQVYQWGIQTASKQENRPSVNYYVK